MLGVVLQISGLKFDNAFKESLIAWLQKQCMTLGLSHASADRARSADLSGQACIIRIDCAAAGR